MKYFLPLIILLLSFSNSQAIVNGCERNVNFDNADTYKNITGDINCFSENGKKTRTVSLKKGDIIRNKRYDENGAVEFMESLKNGKREGLLESYYSDGKVKEIQNFKDDKLQGVQKRFYENGKMSYFSYQDPDNSEINSSVDLNEQGEATNMQCGKKYPAQFKKYCTAPNPPKSKSL